MCDDCCKKCKKNNPVSITGQPVEVKMVTPYEGYEDFTFTEVEMYRLREGHKVTKNGIEYHADDEGNIYEYLVGTNLKIGNVPRYL